MSKATEILKLEEAKKDPVNQLMNLFFNLGLGGWSGGYIIENQLYQFRATTKFPKYFLDKSRELIEKAGYVKTDKSGFDYVHKKSSTSFLKCNEREIELYASILKKLTSHFKRKVTKLEKSMVPKVRKFMERYNLDDTFYADYQASTGVYFVYSDLKIPRALVDLTIHILDQHKYTSSDEEYFSKTFEYGSEQFNYLIKVAENRLDLPLYLWEEALALFKKRRSGGKRRVWDE